MTTVLYSYQPFSNGAKELSRALSIRRIRHNGSRFRARQRDTVINWGSSQLPQSLLGAGRIINAPVEVARASNKLSFFNRLSDFEVPVPEWTSDKEVAEAWLDDGCVVVARTTLNGHSGRGIVIVEPDDDLPNAPLYTKYFKKKHEYRVHVGFGEIIDIQKKVRRQDTPVDEVNWQVRNLDGGFIYARNDVELPTVVQDAVNAASQAWSALDFGAYDVIYNQHHNRAAILEVNTAPGLVGTTIQKYVEAFTENL